MRTNRPAMCAAEWMIPDTESVDALIEAVLFEQAWLIAIQSGKHAHRGVVWADGFRRTNDRSRRRLESALVVRVAAKEG